MIMENLGCNYSYFSFSISCYAYNLEFTDFAFDAKSEHMACFHPKKFQSVTWHSIATTKNLYPTFFRMCVTLAS